MSGIGHNGGPSVGSGASWRAQCWRVARADLLPRLPLEVVRLRVKRAQEIGLAYRTYAGVRAARAMISSHFCFRRTRCVSCARIRRWRPRGAESWARSAMWAGFWPHSRRWTLRACATDLPPPVRPSIMPTARPPATAALGRDPRPHPRACWPPRACPPTGAGDRRHRRRTRLGRGRADGGLPARRALFSAGTAPDGHQERYRCPDLPKTDWSDAISSVEEIIEDARNGRMFILVDHEDRENEGDLVIPAQMATPEAINFMATHGRGLICLALPGARIDALGLPLMSTNNSSRHETAFTVSIEAREGVTHRHFGRMTARAPWRWRSTPAKGAADIATPGHVFPLRARDGGVLVRAGHTEAAVDISPPCRAEPVGRDLRDHERRRHHGAAARSGGLRAEAQPEDRHDQRSDRLSPPPRQPGAQARGRARHVANSAATGRCGSIPTRPRAPSISC